MLIKIRKQIDWSRDYNLALVEGVACNNTRYKAIAIDLNVSTMSIYHGIRKYLPHLVDKLDCKHEGFYSTPGGAKMLSDAVKNSTDMFMVADELGIQYQSALITVKRYLPDEVARLRSYRKRTPKHSKAFIDRLMKMRDGGTTRLNIMAELDLTLSQYQYCMHLNRQNERMRQVRCIPGIKTQKKKQIRSQVRFNVGYGFVGRD